MRNSDIWLLLLLQAEVLGYLEKACQLIPDQGMTAECKEIVDDYYPIIIGIITGELVSTVNLIFQILACFQFKCRLKPTDWKSSHNN